MRIRRVLFSDDGVAFGSIVNVEGDNFALKLGTLPILIFPFEHCTLNLLSDLESGTYWEIAFEDQIIFSGI